jgi:hypothetical protein
MVGASLLVTDTDIPNHTTFALRGSFGNETVFWMAEQWLPDWRGQAQYALAGGFLYALGGYMDAAHNNLVMTDVLGVAVAADGTLGRSFATSSLPAPTAFGEAIAVDDYIFVVGGRGAVFGAAGRADVVSAHVGSDGQLTPFAAQSPLPEARTNHDSALGGDYLYITGGAVNGPGLDTVFAGRVRY